MYKPITTGAGQPCWVCLFQFQPSTNVLVKLQQPCTCSYGVYVKGLGGFPIHRKHHDWTIKLTGLSLLYAGLRRVVMAYATVGLIKNVLTACQLLLCLLINSSSLFWILKV